MKQSLSCLLSICALAAGVFHSVSASAASPTQLIPLFSDKGEASYSLSKDPVNNAEMLSFTETRYLELRYPTPYLLKARITRASYTAGEGESGMMELSIRTDGATRFGNLLWSKHVEGSEVKFVGQELVGATQWGCCGAQDVTRLYNLKTGDKVEAALGKVITLTVPNSSLKARYLSLAIDSRAPKTFQNKSYIGTVSYFSSDKIIARARIYANMPEGWATEISNLEIADGSKKPHDETEVELWLSDGIKDAAKAFSGFSLQAQALYDSQTETISIAINGDSIDKSATSVSSGLAFDIVK